MGFWCHRDEHGHAEQLHRLKHSDLARPLQLRRSAIREKYPYSTDIKQIAHDVNRQNPAYTRRFD